LTCNRRKAGFKRGTIIQKKFKEAMSLHVQNTTIDVVLGVPVHFRNA
jgi:hypothetical protein